MPLVTCSTLAWVHRSSVDRKARKSAALNWAPTLRGGVVYSLVSPSFVGFLHLLKIDEIQYITISTNLFVSSNLKKPLEVIVGHKTNCIGRDRLPVIDTQTPKETTYRFMLPNQLQRVPCTTIPWDTFRYTLQLHSMPNSIEGISDRLANETSDTSNEQMHPKLQFRSIAVRCFIGRWCLRRWFWICSSGGGIECRGRNGRVTGLHGPTRPCV